MKVFVVLVTLVASVAAFESYFRIASPYRYRCSEEKCVKEEVNAPPKPQNHQDTQYNTLAECNLVCGQYGSLWPHPTKRVNLAKETYRFVPRNIRFTKVSANNPEVEEMLMEQSHYFQRNLHFMHPEYPQQRKEPFFDYQEEKFQNYDKYLRSDFQQEESSYNVQRYDLFDRNYQLHRRYNINERQSQRQTQSFDQMRYERISPFNKQQADPVAEKQKFDIEITVTGQETQLRLDTDESYDLTVQTVGDTTTATIIASEYYGARHALETLSQLIDYDELSNSLQVVKTAKISDEPTFKYRGLLLDTGRNFYPKEEILSLLDTMATNKLNTFHWHISDSASFPLYTQREPQMTYYGAYSPSKVYYPQDVREIVEYANQRGIRVVPELDAPAHAGAGWNFGEHAGKGKLVLCNDPEDVWFEECKEPPCGQLNPTNEEVYNVLKNVYSDILEAFNPEFVHMGGDDTSFKCWSNSPEVTNFLTEQGRPVNSQELFKLWDTFQSKAYAKLTESQQETGISRSVTPMLYSSSFVRNFIDPKEYVVQLTAKANDTEIEQYLTRGYRVVFSNSDVWSFEGPAASWVSQRDTYFPDVPRPSWKNVYENSPLGMFKYAKNPKDNTQQGDTEPHAQQGDTEPHAEQILGGEGTVWSYETDAQSLQSTVWPRGAALAERLWSDPSQSYQQADQAENRMGAHRERMVNRGTRAEAIQPEFCFQNQNSCYTQEYKERLRSQLSGTRTQGQ